LENGAITPATIGSQTKLSASLMCYWYRMKLQIQRQQRFPRHGISARKGLAASSNIVASRIYMEMPKINLLLGSTSKKWGIGTGFDWQRKNIKIFP